MKKIYLVTTLLLMFAISMAAQQAKTAPQQAGSNAAQAQSGSPEQNAPAAKAESTIQGCLAASGSSFTLTDKAGKTYQLEGDSSKLTSHVGHELQLTGTEAAGDAASSASPSVFTVKKIKMLGSSCAAK
jgi:hypothetical protein